MFAGEKFMSVSQPQPVIDAAAGKAVLTELCQPFAGDGFVPQCSIIQPQNIPHPEDDLLVHHDHMTVTLQRHHKKPVEVMVMDERLEDHFYRRKIKLTLAGTDRIVELGGGSAGSALHARACQRRDPREENTAGCDPDQTQSASAGEAAIFSARTAGKPRAQSLWRADH